MCCNGKCLYFLAMETGSLIWAILCMVITGICSVGFFVGIIYNITNVQHVTRVTPSMHEEECSYDVRGATIVFSVMVIINIIEFVFSTFLLMGVMHKYAGYIKAYFIYGVLKTIVIGILAITSLILTFYLISDVSIALIIFFVLHCPMLVMVRKTYLKLSGGEMHQTQFTLA